MQTVSDTKVGSSSISCFTKVVKSSKGGVSKTVTPSCCMHWRPLPKG